jgi:hypothetical protein
MNKILFGLTAVALGALAGPAMAQHHSGGPSAGGGVSAGGRAGASAAPMSAPSGGNFSATGHARGNATLGTRNAWEGRNFVSNEARSNIRGNIRGNIRSDRLAWDHRDGRRHHRHHRNFFPGAAFGFYDDDYALYDTCWDYVWTPAGYERVYTCGGPGFAYYDY